MCDIPTVVKGLGSKDKMENKEVKSAAGSNGFIPLVTVVGFHHAR